MRETSNDNNNNNNNKDEIIRELISKMFTVMSGEQLVCVVSATKLNRKDGSDKKRILALTSMCSCGLFCC